MTHELAVALQQVGRIPQRCAVEKPHGYVRSEHIDVAEWRISQTCNRTAVMHKLPDFVAAFSHHIKPLARDSSQSARMRSFSHASMAGSRSTAPLNRSNSVLIPAPLSALEIFCVQYLRFEIWRENLIGKDTKTSPRKRPTLSGGAQPILQSQSLDP